MYTSVISLIYWYSLVGLNIFNISSIIYLYIIVDMFINCFIFINIFIKHINDYFVYFCTDLLIKHSVNMNKIFIVRVEKPSKNSNEPFKKVYERQIPFDDSLTFPYSSLYASMRFLYGDDCMVSFIVY